MREANLLNKWHHLITDNWYTRTKLARDLHFYGTHLTGTVRSDARGMPRTLKESRLGVGMTKYMRSGSVLAVAFREKESQRKPVFALSTLAHAENKEKRTAHGRVVTKPAMITDHYNAGMGGVDLSDKQSYHYSSARATHKYWLGLFWNLVDKTILNAYIIYAQNTDEDVRLTRRDFVVNLIEELCRSEDPLPEPEATLPGAARHELKKLQGQQERDCVVCGLRCNGQLISTILLITTHTHCWFLCFR